MKIVHIVGKLEMHLCRFGGNSNPIRQPVREYKVDSGGSFNVQ